MPTRMALPPRMAANTIGNLVLAVLGVTFLASAVEAGPSGHFRIQCKTRTASPRLLRHDPAPAPRALFSFY